MGVDDTTLGMDNTPLASMVAATSSIGMSNLGHFNICGLQFLEFFSQPVVGDPCLAYIRDTWNDLTFEDFWIEFWNFENLCEIFVYQKRQ